MHETRTFLYAADRLAAAWVALEKRQTNLDREFKRQAATIAKYLREHGSRPRRAPGMTVALGAVYEIASILMRRNKVDRKGAEKFLRQCPRAALRRVLLKQTAYAVAPGAEKLLMREASARLLELFRRAVKTKKLAPRIRVRELQTKELKMRRFADDAQRKRRAA